MRFVNSVINDFESKERDPMIPSYLFEESNPTVLIEVSFCIKNEKKSKQLLKKLNALTKEKYDIRIVKTKQFFLLKEKNTNCSCKVFEKKCSSK